MANSSENLEKVIVIYYRPENATPPPSPQKTGPCPGDEVLVISMDSNYPDIARIAGEVALDCNLEDDTDDDSGPIRSHRSSSSITLKSDNGNISIARGRSESPLPPSRRCSADNQDSLTTKSSSLSCEYCLLS